MKTNALVYFTEPYSGEISMGTMTSVKRHTVLVEYQNKDYVIPINLITLCKKTRCLLPDLNMN
jgi:hypothetical protein